MHSTFYNNLTKLANLRLLHHVQWKLRLFVYFSIILGVIWQLNISNIYVLLCTPCSEGILEKLLVRSFWVVTGLMKWWLSALRLPSLKGSKNCSSGRGLQLLFSTAILLLFLNRSPENNLWLLVVINFNKWLILLIWFRLY